ncbi:MAG: spermidine synthase, partial [Planctomycetota bacterium]
TRDANERLYSRTGIEAAKTALRAGGVLAIWSAVRHEWFTNRLQSVGFRVTEKRVQARRDKGPKRVIWLAEKGRD